MINNSGISKNAMEKPEYNTWAQLQKWMDQFKVGQRRFAFRGQADCEWQLQTSLARHFRMNCVNARQWRTRELKMYCSFRKSLIEICHDLYESWEPQDILSLMQHHKAPTRLLDFSYDPKVAAYFALKDFSGDSAIWVVDSEFLENRRKEKVLPDYCGPTHYPTCDVFHKGQDGRHLLIGAILDPANHHGRLKAQRGCFFVPGSISKPIAEEFIYAKVTLTKELRNESLKHLKKQKYDDYHLFPDFDKIANEVKRSSVTGGDSCSCKSNSLNH